MHAAAQRIVAALQLEPLPGEGGFYRQTWRGPAGSAIYFLLTPENFSALHRLRADEVWHFYAGDPVEHIQLDPRDRSVRARRLGPNVIGGDTPQLIVPAGVWHGARCDAAPAGVSGPSLSSGAARTGPGSETELRAGWSLLGCTLAPAWREEDFELGERSALQRLFPAQAGVIAALTR